jgi:molybdate transport system ATP-binding protein
VARNIDFAGCQGARRDRAIEVLGLGDLLERMPSSLSGGEAQRVALARAIASEPDLLLLDEPLSGVDLPRRARIFRLLQQIRDTFELPMLYVSHDPAEVLAIAEHACLLEDGLLVASGTPESLLGDASALRFIDHLGFDNVLRVQRVEGRARTPGGRLLHAPPAPGSGEAGWLAVRSQDVMLATEEPRGLSARNCFPAEILSMDTQDGGVQVTLQAEDLWRARLTEAAVTELGLEVGLSAWLVVKTHSLHWLAD